MINKLTKGISKSTKNSTKLLNKIKIPNLGEKVQKESNIKLFKYTILFLSFLTYIFLIIEILYRVYPIIFNKPLLSDSEEEIQKYNQIIGLGLVVSFLAGLLTYYFPLLLRYSIPILFLYQIFRLK